MKLFKSYGLILGDFYIQDISPIEDEQLKMYKMQLLREQK